MAKQISLDFIDSLGNGKDDFYQAKSTNVKTTVLKLGILYAKHMADELNKAHAVSSGKSADSLNPDEVVTNNGVTSVNIKGSFYLKFVDKGVNGWAQNRGSIYQYKTKGVKAGSPMVNSIKAYLEREKGFTKDKYKSGKAINDKEEKRNKLKNVDITTRRAMTVSYMIKRMGLKPTHFLSKATEKVKKDIVKELGEAFKNDIISQIN
jgi:hypothetical protein